MTVTHGRAEPLIVIDREGHVEARSSETTELLARAAGRYRLVTPVGDLLVFQRETRRPDTERKSAIAICGEIDAPGAMANIFNFLHMSQWDGVLHVCREEARKLLFFGGGQLLAAQSNLPEDRLGAILVRFGRLSPDALEACLREVTPRRRIGNVLVEKGILSVHGLYEGVKLQAEEIFHSVLAFRHGSFAFVKQQPAAVPAHLHLDTQALLLEGLRRIDELSYFRATLPSADVVLRRRHPSPAGELDGHARLVHDAVDGARTLGEIARHTRLGEFAATKAAFELVQTGWVEVAEVALRRPKTVPPARLPADAAETIVATYSGALVKLHAALLDRSKAEAVRQGVAVFIAATPRYEALFAGVEPAPDGSLPVDRILENLARIPEESRLETLQRGLNELLFFSLFIAGNAIHPDSERELHESVARALEKLPSAT